MSGNRPDLHTPQHDQWDQGGYCNSLVTDDDGCGVVCGYRAPSEYTPTTRQDVKFKFTEYGYLTDNPDHDDRAEALRFDRWLSEHDRQVAERAWDRCVGEMPIDPDWKNFYSDQNPYTKEEQS